MPGPHTPLPQTLCGPYHLGPALSRDVPGVRYAEVHCNQTPQTQSGHLQLRAWRGPGRPRRIEHLAGDPLIRLISTGFSFFLAVLGLCCGTLVFGAGFFGWATRASLQGMWDFSSLTRDLPTSPALEGRFLTTGPPGKFPDSSHSQATVVAQSPDRLSA